jgi:PiT family inorganic phosphate transporter
MIAIFLTSGLFLGWSLGANDAANVFGTAVGTRMIRFRTSALIASVFVVLGAVVGGAGATHTLGKLGSVNALAGSFMVALGAGVAIFLMVKVKLPVSTSQAIVGAIIGWNIFSGTVTDYSTLKKIVSTWVLCPALSALVAVMLYYMMRFIMSHMKIHLLMEDIILRWGLLIVGAFGSYSLGANNIANVMGVFVPAVPLPPIHLFGNISLNGAQQLFFIGGIAISVGIFSYSYKVMETVGNGILRLSPITALIVVLSQAIVLFLFSSRQLEGWLIARHLPSLPLVPVSSSQAVVGAVIGIGLVRGGHGINYGILGKISSGWVMTPIIAGVITLVGLFFLQNVFSQEVNKPENYLLSENVIHYLETEKIESSDLYQFQDKPFVSSAKLLKDLKNNTNLSRKQILKILESSKVSTLRISNSKLLEISDMNWFSQEQIAALKALAGETYDYGWQFYKALSKQTSAWGILPATKKNRIHNEKIKSQISYLQRKFSDK